MICSGRNILFNRCPLLAPAELILKRSLEKSVEESNPVKEAFRKKS